MIYVALYIAIGIIVLAGIAKMFEMYNGNGYDGLVKFVKDYRNGYPGKLELGIAFTILAWPYLMVATIVVTIRSIWEINKIKRYITKQIMTEESSE